MDVLSPLRGALKIEACPVLLPWFKTRDAREPANRLRRVAIERWWRAAGPRRAELALAAALWPLLATARSLVNLHRSGAYVARTYGVPRWRQLADMLWAAQRWNINPQEYYLTRLFARSRPVAHVLARHEVALVLARLCEGLDQGKLDDKARFHEHARAHGLPVAETYAVFQDGALSRWLDARRPDDVPAAGLVLKATSLSGGRGFERWRLVDDARRELPLARRGAAAAADRRWRRGDETLTRAALLERARARSASSGRVIVQRALDNHPELAQIAPDALSTLRVITYRRPGHAPETLYAGLRVPGAGVEVDNLGQGGAMADVLDLTQGTLAAAEPDRVERGALDAHPLTGAAITGRRLPRWPEPLELCARAHATLPELPFVGWDVAITPDGAVLVEGNTVWGGCERVGLGGTAFTTCALEHLERARAA